MIQLSHPPVLGAFIGLVLGLVEYLIAMSLFRAYVAREVALASKAGEILPGLDNVVSRMRALRYGLLALAVIVYPAIGYAVGTIFLT